MKPYRYLYQTAGLLMCCLFLWQASSAQFTPLRSPKRELRAVWVASVANIDYPRQPTTERIALQEEYKNMLDQFQEMGFNAVIMQVRPAGDAFYPSDFAPWSKYLTGRQGMPPNPLFDPMAFMVEETHRRGMEFHAWLNPYRATVDLDTFSLAQSHAFNSHRDWMVPFGGKFYFNPALPQVREHIVNVVGELSANYNVDAIHFDDYFYPYKINNQTLTDTAEFAAYGADYENVEDWRRANVDDLIEKVHKRIKEVKPHVKFGISPFGVWRNKAKDPFGSDTRAGQTTYDDLYADVLKWVRLDWIDYVMPQLYWHIGFEAADHAKLLTWWSGQMGESKCKLYIGYGAYKVGENRELPWHEPDQIPRQIDLSRRNEIVDGGAYFSARSILRNPLGLKDSIRVYHRDVALIPEQTSANLPLPTEPTLRSVRRKGRDVRLRWAPNPADTSAQPYYYVIYRFDDRSAFDTNNPKNILGVSPFYDKKPKSRDLQFIDKTAVPGTVYTYVVTAVSRQHSESRTSNRIKVLKRERGVRRVRSS